VLCSVLRGGRKHGFSAGVKKFSRIGRKSVGFWGWRAELADFLEGGGFSLKRKMNRRFTQMDVNVKRLMNHWRLTHRVSDPINTTL